jgi:hypothetical protein
MPDLEQSGIDPDETLPYCDGFPLLGPSSLDGPGTGTKDDVKDSQWGPADEQTDDDNSIKQADPTDFQVPGQDADKSVLVREAPPEAQDGGHCRCVYQGKDNTEAFPSERLCVLEDAYIYRM